MEKTTQTLKVNFNQSSKIANEVALDVFVEKFEKNTNKTVVAYCRNVDGSYDLLYQKD